MDDWRYRSQQSPRTDTNSTTSYISPPRNTSSNLNGSNNGSGYATPTRQSQMSNSDTRSGLTRRFTTDSGLVPTLSTMVSPPRNNDQPQEYNSRYTAIHMIEQKRIEFERIREQRKRFELEMARLDQQQRKEAHELARMEEEARLNGHQSEPTTPPEYHDNSGFPSMLSRPSRYSISGLTSPQAAFYRSQRSGSQLASPPSGMMPVRYGHEEQTSSHLPSRSVPGTRRNSDDEDKHDAVRQDPTSNRSSNALNRYSMPVTRPRNGLHESNIDQTNTARFLFGDDEPNLPRGGTPDDHFPTLVRREDSMLSASSAALDLALSASPSPEATSPRGWSSVNRHRPQQSLPAFTGIPAVHNGDGISLGNRGASLRNSIDLKYFSESSGETQGAVMAASVTHPFATPPKLQSSYSSNDVPTMKNPSGSSLLTNNANNHAQQHLHNHNASIGRIPQGILPTRHSREMSNESNTMNTNREQVQVQQVQQAQQYPSIQSALQANAAPFGPSSTIVTAPHQNITSSSNGVAGINHYNGFYPPNGYAPPHNTNNMGVTNGLNGVTGNLGTGNNFGVPMLTAGLQQMNMGQGNGGNIYPQQNFAGYGAAIYNGPAPSQPPRDSQARVIQSRRQMDNEAMSRYQGTPLEHFHGQIYELCKDQHGCRYLQKKLEERNPEQVHNIWLETNQHVIELMTDPFGNYLCQKLLEYCNDDERTVLIQNASKDMVRIALNQHGTRALQKMIEYISTPQQVQLIIEALRFRVVELIQDLNGNHVIQKCLNKLVAADAQFIFDAVGNHCVEVGTHRHGCCVLQRCIDHASGDQKLWLVKRITEHARILVQDPFGNYVVQYIIDLNEPTFTEPAVEMFRGCIPQLSRHKFSSNVIEKCLRCSQPPSKDMIVEELLAATEIEKLLRDSFANYVIQTALDYATPQQKHRLIESIRPHLPNIRATPYGRRIQSKVVAYDNRGSAASSGQATPADNTQGQIPLRQAHSRGASGNNPLAQSANDVNAGVRQNNLPAYPSSRILTVPLPNTNGGGQLQHPTFNQNGYASNGIPASNGVTSGLNGTIATGGTQQWF